MKTNEKTGGVIGALTVNENDEIMLITTSGKIIRMSVNSIPVIGRNTQGVRLINLEEGEHVSAVAKLAEAEEDETEEKEPS